jgi:hypothetical protein
MSTKFEASRAEQARSRQLWSGTLAKGDAERIRRYLCGQVDLARKRGGKTLVFRAGDVHKALGFENRMPNVCQALKGPLFRKACRVEIVQFIYSPPSKQGANLEVEFRIL